jgi:KDO2-lipid IV(A) lauroyltransferase
LGLFGDLPTKGIIAAVRILPKMPRFAETGLIWFFSGIVLLLAHKERRAIRSNLQVVWDDLGWLEGYVAVLRVFINFGWTYVDGLREREGLGGIEWAMEGAEHFEQIRGNETGTLILTTHTGNYDLAGAIFAEKFERPLHIVRMPERSEHLRTIRERELANDEERYPFFKVHYNESMNFLGLELAQLLMDRQLVAIQGDRVMGEVSALSLSVEGGARMRVPKGPMTLAALANSQCYPLFVVRDGYRKYRVIFREALPQATQRGRREEELGKAWVAELTRFLREYGLQWFVFEPAFEKSA